MAQQMAARTGFDGHGSAGGPSSPLSPTGEEVHHVWKLASRPELTHAGGPSLIVGRQQLSGRTRSSELPFQSTPHKMVRLPTVSQHWHE